MIYMSDDIIVNMHLSKPNHQDKAPISHVVICNLDSEQRAMLNSILDDIMSKNSVNHSFCHYKAIRTFKKKGMLEVLFQFLAHLYTNRSGFKLGDSMKVKTRLQDENVT